MQLQFWLKYIKNFGIKMTCYRWMSMLSKHKMRGKYQEQVLFELEKKYQKTINGDYVKNEEYSSNGSKYIWSMWWQGYAQAPAIVKKCIDSVQASCKDGYNYVLIDQNNYKEYIEVPYIIEKKLSEGVFSITFFSDYMRSALLEKYGGFWLDTSIFASNSIPIFDSNVRFASMINPNTKVNSHYISEGKWVIGCMYSAKNTRLMHILKKCLEDYWIKESMCIDYFITDTFIEILYRLDSECKDIIDKMVVISGNPYELSNKMNLIFNDDYYEEILKQPMHIISRKKEYVDEIDGKQTWYGYWMKH